MTEYAKLMQQAQELINKADAIKKAEKDAVINDIKDKMREYGIAPEDLGNVGAGRKVVATKSKAPAKYRGPNGQLWSGGPGRKPEWAKAAIAANELGKYLIS